MNEKIRTWQVRQRLLEADVDRFFRQMDICSARLAWFAIAGAIIIIGRMLWRVAR